MLCLGEVKNRSWKKPRHIYAGHRTAPLCHPLAILRSTAECNSAPSVYQLLAKYRSKWFNLYTRWQKLLTALPSRSACGVLDFFHNSFQPFGNPSRVSTLLSSQTSGPSDDNVTWRSCANARQLRTIRGSSVYDLRIRYNNSCYYIISPYINHRHAVTTETMWDSIKDQTYERCTGTSVRFLLTL
jgi:hypothetical protein